MDSKKRLEKALSFIENKENLTRAELTLALGYKSKNYLSDLVTSEKPVTEFALDKLEAKFGIQKKYILTGEGEMILEKSNNSNQENINGRSVRKPKIESNPEKEGVLFVPISAQAGYSQKFLDPIYLNQLERVYMPGFPYRGDNFRIFEVAGDSMEPTLKEGYFVVGEKVEPDYWTTVADYYIYVIVTTDRCIVKRLVKRDDSFVAISDNEFHPQFVIKFEDIRELWYVKRKMDWEMPPPKRFEIKV